MSYQLFSYDVYIFIYIIYMCIFFCSYAICCIALESLLYGYHDSGKNNKKKKLYETKWKTLQRFYYYDII